MASSPLIAVTGASGNLGGQVARQLAESGANLRLIARDADRIPSLPGASAAAATYGDATSSAAALAGVEVLFLVSAAENRDRAAHQSAFVDAAARAGVRHIVYTSFMDAAADSTFTLGRDHGATEDRIRDSGVPFTFLRDNFYLDILPFFAGEDGVIRGPAGDGAVSAVARADVARAAAAILLDPVAHAGQAYDMTGPEALTFTQVAATITEVSGRPVRYHAETVEEAYASRAVHGAEDWQVDAWVSTYTAIASGSLARRSDTVERITGRRPMALREVLEAAR